MPTKKRLLTDEEIEFLAQAYLKLQEDITFRNLTKTFQDYCNEFLEKELLTIKKIQEAHHGKS